MQNHLTDPTSFPRPALTINPNPNPNPNPPAPATPPTVSAPRRRPLHDRGTVSAPTSPLRRGTGLWDSPGPHSAGGLFDTLASSFSDPLSSGFSTHPYPSSLFSPSNGNVTHSHSHPHTHAHAHAHAHPNSATTSTRSRAQTHSQTHSHSHSHSQSNAGERISFPNVPLPFHDLPSAATDFPGLSLPFYAGSDEHPDYSGSANGTYGLTPHVDVNSDANTHDNTKTKTNINGDNVDSDQSHGHGFDEANRPGQDHSDSSRLPSRLHTPTPFGGITMSTGPGTGMRSGPGTGIRSGIRTGMSTGNGNGIVRATGLNSDHSELGLLDEHDVHHGPTGKKQKRAQVRVACTHCQKACKKCSNTRPCERCVKYGLNDCIDSTRKPRKTGVKRGPYKRRSSKFDFNPLQPPATAHPHPHTHTRLAPPPPPRNQWFGAIATQPVFPAHPGPPRPAHISLSGIHGQSATIPGSFARGSVDPRQGQAQAQGRGQVQGRVQGHGQTYQHQAHPWQTPGTDTPAPAPGLHGDPVPPPRSRGLYPLHRAAGFEIRHPDADAAGAGADTGDTAAGDRAGRNTSNPEGATLSPQLLQPRLGLSPVQAGSQTHAQSLRRPSLPHGTLPSLPSDAGLHSAFTAALAGPRWVNGQRVSSTEYTTTDQSPRQNTSTSTTAYPAPFHVSAGPGGSLAGVGVDGGGVGGVGGVGGIGGDDSPGVLLPETPKVPFPISLRGGGDPFSRAVSPIRSNGHTSALFDQSHAQGDGGRTMFVDALLRSLGRETEALGSGSGSGSGPGLGGAEATMQSRSGMRGVHGSAPNSPGAGVAVGSWHAQAHAHTPGQAGLRLGLGHNLHIGRDDTHTTLPEAPGATGTWTDHLAHFGPVFSEPTSPTQPTNSLGGGGLPFPRSASAGPQPHPHPHPSSAPPLSTHFHFDSVTPGSNDVFLRRTDRHALSGLPNASGQVTGQGQGQGHARGQAQAHGGSTTGGVGVGAGTGAGHFLPHSPALIALKKIRQPSLRTLISPLSSVTNSRAPSPIQEDQSPMLWNGPMHLDDVDELDGMGMGLGLGLGLGLGWGARSGSESGGLNEAAVWGLPSGSATSGSASASASMSTSQAPGPGQEHQQLYNQQENRAQYDSAQTPGRSDGEALEGEEGGHGATDPLGLMGLEGVFGA